MIRQFPKVRQLHWIGEVGKVKHRSMAYKLGKKRTNCNRTIHVQVIVKDVGLVTFFWDTVYINDVVSRLLSQRYLLIIYACDILVIYQSVNELQNIVNICENELNLLDMQINVKKSCCMRIGQRHNAKCADITGWTVVQALC